MNVVLQTKNLHKTYDRKVKALEGVELEIKEGEVFGILGPNGAGKTTLIKIMVGILKADQGEIFLNSRKINGTNELKGIIGYAPQELVFYPFLTVLENMRLFATLYRVERATERIDELLELFHLKELSNRIAEKMSGGQKRRLNIALSLLHSPKILFLDEPSAGMDPQSRNVLWESVKQLQEHNDVTIILTTHLMEVADRLSDRIAIIDHGKVLTVDTPEALKTKYAGIGTLKIQFAKKLPAKAHKEIMDKLQDRYGQIAASDNAISIKAKEGFKAISEIMKIFQELSVDSYVTDVQLRQGTLEDVFLQLTGKELRENNVNGGGDQE